MYWCNGLRFDQLQGSGTRAVEIRNNRLFSARHFYHDSVIEDAAVCSKYMIIYSTLVIVQWDISFNKGMHNIFSRWIFVIWRPLLQTKMPFWYGDICSWDEGFFVIWKLFHRHEGFLWYGDLDSRHEGFLWCGDVHNRHDMKALLWYGDENNRHGGQYALFCWIFYVRYRYTNTAVTQSPTGFGNISSVILSEVN